MLWPELEIRWTKCSSSISSITFLPFPFGLVTLQIVASFYEIFSCRCPNWLNSPCVKTFQLTSYTLLRS